jgi:tRNA(Ile)-lysidine synthase TilS/MesJ
MPFVLIDRLNKRETLDAHHTETVGATLRHHFIPPSSVLVSCDGVVVSDAHRIDIERNYEARLIEGYDIEQIRSALTTVPQENGGAYLKRRVLPAVDGSLTVESSALDERALSRYVLDTILDTCRTHSLIRENDRVLVGLSGGVDSSSLLLALAELRPSLPRFELVAVTFEDFDSKESPTFKHAHDLAQRLDITHHVAPATTVEKVFGLKKPLRQILPELMATKYSTMAMYIDHHTTRRALELFAEENGIGRIALGLHTTDLLAGLLNSIATGYTVASLPLRRIGALDYIYPLAYIAKRELHLYHYHRTGTLARHSFPNPWERNPLDRNFYYYLADMLQEYWPGLETFVLSSHNWRLRRERPIQTETCKNCGSTLLVQPFMITGQDECEACQVLLAAGYR